MAGTTSGAGDSFAAVLRGHRVAANLTQEELAERSGLSVQAIGMLERGVRRAPRASTITLLAEALALEPPARGALVAAARGQAEPGPTSLEAPVPAQLPRSIGDFTGRQAEVDLAAAHLGGCALDAGSGATQVIAVTGAAGAGKTTLALRIAHGHRERFADGQLFVDLHGAEGERLGPGAVLAGFLRALGIDGSVIPTELDELVALYRARLIDRRVLVVLDNAADEAQVRPLLPSGPECAALVTSRAPLGGLEGARHIPLDVLPAREALDLLSKVAGRWRAEAEPDAAAEIVRLCGCLPLAVRIAGARLAARPRWRLDTFATRLADERHRLDELRVGDLAVRASVALSYRALDADTRRGFRFLAVLDAPDLTAWLAGALFRKRAHDAEALLERLVDAHLLESVGDDGTLPVRYRLHGLVRLFARELLDEEEDGEARRLGALARALGAQLALAEQARVALSPGDAALVLGGEAVRWLVDHEVVDLVVRDPLAWFEAERPSLLASVVQACRAGLHGAAWELAASLSTFFAIRGHWDDWRSTHQLVIRSTRDAGDRRGELQAGFLLADSHLWFGDVVSAQPLLERCLELAEELGDELGDAMCQFGLALAATMQGDVETADARLEQGLAYFERTGSRHGRALMLAVRGLLLRTQDRCGDAVASLREALATFVGEGDRHWEALSLMWLADVHAQAGAMADAERCLERCIRGFDGLGNRQFAAMGRFRLVEIRLPLVGEDEAIAGLSECARVFAELGMRSNQARAVHLLASRRRERATLL